MSRGTEIYTVRIPTTLSEKLVSTIARRNLGSKEQPWTTSDFIRIAIAEKILKMERGRGVRAKGKVTDAADWIGEQEGRLVTPGFDDIGDDGSEE